MGLHLKTVKTLAGSRVEGAILPSIVTMAMMRAVEISRKNRKDLTRALLMVSQLISMDQSEVGQ
jgi:hypothetical protein